MDINSICQIPELLLENISNNDTLKDLFVNISRESFLSMMSHTINHLLEDNFELPPGHTSITAFQSKAWLDCYNKTLDQLPLSDEIRRKLVKNMVRLVNIMTRQSYINNGLYETVCIALREKLNQSENPVELLRKIECIIFESN